MKTNEKDCWSSERINLKNIDTYIELTGCYESVICQLVCPVSRVNTYQFIGQLVLLWLAQASMDSNNEDTWKETVNTMLEMCEECGVCWGSCPSKTNIFELAINELKKSRQHNKEFENSPIAKSRE